VKFYRGLRIRETEFLVATTKPEFEQGHSAVRAILGGTGKYMGARGQVTSARNADASYTQVFTLLK
jgi:hypothetical protein